MNTIQSSAQRHRQSVTSLRFTFGVPAAMPGAQAQAVRVHFRPAMTWGLAQTGALFGLLVL